MQSERSECGRLVIDSAHISDSGDRESNQDAYRQAQQGDLSCFVVSDGAGGHAGGEIAANIAVNAVIDAFMQELSFGIRPLQFYAKQATHQVETAKNTPPALSDMTATLAILLIDQENKSALWAHLGDTRIYVFRDGKLLHVTRDHSLVQQLIDAGYCSPEVLRTHPQRSVLYAAVGTSGDISPEIPQQCLTVETGDAFLICTDGFWEWITESDMELSLVSALSATHWLQQMQEILEKNSSIAPKSRDNYTAQAIWLGHN